MAGRSELTEKQEELRRPRVLVASCAISLCIGCGYAWSVLQVGFVEEAEEIFGRNVPASAIALAFTICSGISPVPMILAGVLQRRFSARSLIAAGGSLFCVGYFLTGFTSSLLMLYLTYGLMVGIGSPIVYNIVLNNLIPFFPEKKGFATGVMTALYGGSSVVCAQLMQHFIDHGGVLYNFRMMGILFAGCICVSTLFIRQGPGILRKPCGTAGKGVVVVKDRRFPFLFGLFTASCICGLMIITQSGSMAQVIGKVENVAGIVSLMGLANVAGRLSWGWLSDRIGRYNALLTTCSIMAVSGLALALAGSHYMVFVGFAALTVFSYGGSVGVVPPLLVELYGAGTGAINYGIICIGYAIGGYAGPMIATTQFVAYKTYHTSFLLICLAAVMAVLCIIILKRSERRQKA